MKKCIVLDLDNTLWGGLVGEDGAGGIELALRGTGADFIAFQQALLDLYNRGIILAINSANNPDDALGVIRTNPNMILKEHHFAAMRINWNDKTENIKEIAEELNIGLDSMVFLDDNPTNREAMRSFVPEVETPELPTQSKDYTSFLLALPHFETNTITLEDTMRGSMYVTERLRMEAEKAFLNREDFLKSLDTKVKFFEDDVSALPRLAQMTEKTNQFNTNKTPMTEDEVRDFALNDAKGLFYTSASDRFGDHGIIVLAFIHKSEKDWRIDPILMSCRVIGRGIEDAFLYMIAQAAKKAGAETLSVNFIHSEKNQPAKSFIERHWGESQTMHITNITKPDWITII